jgi:hypothetical protein
MFYRFGVLPFGISTAPWLFTKVQPPPLPCALSVCSPSGAMHADCVACGGGEVMNHCGRFLRSRGLGLDLLIYLDDLIFAAPTARHAL